MLLITLTFRSSDYITILFGSGAELFLPESLHRAYALLTLGRHDEAMANWDKALEIDPNYANAYANKACCFALQNQVELALENLQRAIELEPEKYREMAKTDSDFDGIRGDVRFQELLGNGFEG